MPTRLDFSTLSLMDALDLATLIEVEAYKRYTQFAERLGSSSDDDAASVFQSMAVNENKHGEETLARFTVRPEFSGGVPGHVFGGMVASLLDCHGTASAAAFAYRAAGREMGDGGEFMRFVTASLKVDFLRPTPIGVELVIKGQLRAIEGRKVQLTLSLSAGGQACARGEMLAVQFRD